MSSVPAQVATDVVTVIERIIDSLGDKRQYTDPLVDADRRIAKLNLEAMLHSTSGSYMRDKRSGETHTWKIVNRLQSLLLEDAGFARAAAETTFLELNSGLVGSPLRSSLIARNNRIFDRSVTVAEAIQVLLSSLVKFLPKDEAENLISSADRLEKILPKQKIAPIQFDIFNGLLVVRQQPAKSLPKDADSVDKALQALVESGEKTLQALRQSNCDPRLIENTAEIQNILVQKRDIIKLGLANISFGMMVEAFKEELPLAIDVMLRSQSISIGMYVSQFTEWEDFSSKSASIALMDTDISHLKEAARNLSIKIQANKDLVSPDVSRIVEFLIKLANDPKGTSKRTAFALLRTFENLVIRVYQYSAEFLDQSIRKTSKSASTAVSVTVMTGLLGLAVATATDILPVASKNPASKWMVEATEIVIKIIRDSKL